MQLVPSREFQHKLENWKLISAFLISAMNRLKLSRKITKHAIHIKEFVLIGKERI